MTINNSKNRSTKIGNEKKRSKQIDLTKKAETLYSYMDGIKMTKQKEKKFVSTGIKGFDSLFEKGIPTGSSVIVAGGTGSGKTNFCLQILAHHASNGKKCYFMGFEESEERLIEHMENFGWKPQQLIKSRNFKIKRFLTSEIYYYDKSTWYKNSRPH